MYYTSIYQENRGIARKCIWIYSSYTINKFAKLFSVKEKDVAPLLRAAGYVKRHDYWEIEYEREYDIKADIKGVYTVIRNCKKTTIKEGLDFWLAKKAKAWSAHLSELHYRLSYSTNAHLVSYDDYVYKEVNYNRKSIWVAMVGIIITIGLIVLMYLINSNYNTVNTKEANTTTSLTSVLLTILSCVTSVVTTVILMRQNYKIDYHKERIEALPVFTASIIPARRVFDHDEEDVITVLKGKINQNISVLNLLDGSQPSVVIKLQNVGKGTAYNICIESDWMEFEEVKLQNFSINQEKFIILNESQSCSFTCKFTDLYGNYYSQEIKADKDKIDEYYDLESDPPKLVFKTKRIRYVQ